MTDTEIKGRAEEEEKRIIDILTDAGVSEKRIKILNPVIVNTSWMKAKLDDSRAAIKNAQIAISYDNGGGQRGIRENPLFKGYESLWKAYIAGMDRIFGSLPNETVDIVAEDIQANEPRTVLELVRGKHKKEA